MFFFSCFSLLLLPFSHCFIKPQNRFIFQNSRSFPLYNPNLLLLQHPPKIQENPSQEKQITNINKPTIFSKIQKKFFSFWKLIRYKNLFPTFLLSLSGGWMMNSSPIELFRCSKFLAATLNTLLIMSSSMVINDLFDINIDKVNHPERPLVTGEVTKVEAVAFSSALLGISQYVSFHFLPDYLQILNNAATLQIILYTPFLKKIFFIKNLSCASLVSFAIFFAGLASARTMIPMEKNFGLFSLMLTLIFLGSLYNELLLDMRDYEGDKDNNISTIPVILGKKYAWFLSNGILAFNIITDYLALLNLFNPTIAFIFLIIMSPMITRSVYIKKKDFSRESIENAVSKTSKQLFLVVLYFCGLVYLK